MSEDRVIYNGVPMHPSWPARIEAAQEMTTYVINGETYDRIRWGEEDDLPDGDLGPCHDCCVLKGQYHVGPVCDMEQCPRCGRQVIACDCKYKGDEEE